MAIINEIQINTEAIPAGGATRYFSITGEEGAQFMLQAVTSEGVFYNFVTKKFTASEGFNSNHNKVVTMSGQFNSSIHFPSGLTTTYSVILLANGFDTTINNDSRKVSVKKITQNSQTTLTFAFATDNSSKYSSSPAPANVTSSGTPGVATSVVVSNTSTVTNADNDTHGSGFAVLKWDRDIVEYNGDNMWYYQKTATVNGASSTDVLTLDSVDEIAVGSQITYTTGTTAPGATTIVKGIDTTAKTLALSRAQAFSDGATVTIRSYGASLINSVAGASVSFPAVVAIKTRGTNKRYTTNGTTTTSNTINLNGSRGLGKGAIISGTGINRSNSGDVIHSVSLSASGGSIVVGDNDAGTSGDLQTLPDKLTIDTDSIITIDVHFKTEVNSYPSTNKTINLDLDKILTPLATS